MKDLTLQQLNDLYVCVSTRSEHIFEGYNELTIDDAPGHILDESYRLGNLLDLIYLEIKSRH